MDKFKDLTDKQKQFCKEYVTDWNATRAAKAAGYSEKTAKDIGCENLAKPNIQAYIEHIQKDLLKLCGVSVLGNVTKLKEIIESDLTDKQSDKIKALEVINKMLGLNAPDKQELKHEGNISNEPSKITFSKKG
jgi:phage terminase small subunit